MFNRTLLPAINASIIEYEAKYESLVTEHNVTVVSSWGISPECTLEKQLGSAAEGTGLAFVVFTQAINELPQPW